MADIFNDVYHFRSPCKNGGLCEDLGGFAPELSCRCLVGFTGPRCETNMDDCLMRPCANGATCVDGVNRFSCLCPVGFTGRFCTINLDDCAGPFKISVVTQRGADGLSESQLVLLLVLGGMTLAVVAVTAGLVLRGQCQDRSARCQCGPAPTHHQCRTHSVQQECKISFLQPPAELEKKRLNTDII